MKYFKDQVYTLNIKGAFKCTIFHYILIQGRKLYAYIKVRLLKHQRIEINEESVFAKGPSINYVVSVEGEGVFSK